VTGATIGLTIRNSTVRQIGNFRSEAQFDMVERLEGRGYQVRVYDEQGISGAHLSKRTVALQMFEDLRQGRIQGIGALDVKRLTRDEFGMDGGDIARRIVDAGGLFATWDRDYDLRNDDDLLQFQFQCMLAGIDWRSIRNTFWSGLFKKLEHEPVYMRPPIGYMTEILKPDDARRVIRRVAKNPDHEELLAELTRLFEDSDSLSQMARRLNTYGPPRPAFKGRGGTTTHWSVQSLRYLLRNTIYTGTFTFGTRLKKRSIVWHRFATDPQTGQPKDFRQHVPELAYWTSAQVRRWRLKFDHPGSVRTVETRHPHPLSGVLECNGCGHPMIARGERTYACSALGTLARSGHTHAARKSVVCAAPQALSPNVAAQLLRHELPRVMYDAQVVATELRAQQQAHASSAAAQRLAFLEDRAKWINDQLWGKVTPPASLIARLGEVEAELAELRDQVAEEKVAADTDAELAAWCQILLESPLDAFDTLPWEQQHRIYRLLFAGVRIEAQGDGFNRRWRLRQYRALTGNQVRVVDGAWARREHPHTSVLCFEPESEACRGNDTYATRHIFPATQLRELASALSAAA
jgi:hypothetical protein